MKKSKRSAALRSVLETLDQMERSAAWLGRSLSPPVSRQTVSDWSDVPQHYVEQVARLLQSTPSSVRPDLAAIFAVPKEAKPSRKRAA